MNTVAAAKIKVPFVDLSRRYQKMRTEVLASFDEIAGSGQYILGDTVLAFEKAMAAYLGCKYVLGVANGTDALIIALKTLGVSDGDEVIVPVNSFIASAGAVAMVGGL